MFGDDAGSDNSREQPKSSRGAFWRDKLKDKASKLTKSKQPSRAQSEQEVSDFLRPGSSSIAPSPSPSPSPNPPRLDTSVPASHAGAPEDQLQQSGYVPPAKKKKRPKPPGLHVGFVEEQPHIIGEGGDEADVPTKDVTAAWLESGKTYEFFNPGEPSPLGRKNSLPTPDLLQPGVDPNTGRRVSIQRAPTRHVAGSGWTQKRRSMSMEEGLVQANRSEPDDLTASVEPSTRPAPVLPDIQALANDAGNPFLTFPSPDSEGREADRNFVPPSQESPRAANTQIPQFMDKPYVSAPQQAAKQAMNEDQGSQSEFIPFHPARQPTLPIVQPPPAEPVVTRRPSLNTQQLPQRAGPIGNKQEFVESPESTLSMTPQINLPQTDREPRPTQPSSQDRFPSPKAPPVQNRLSRGPSPVEGTTIANAEAAAEDFYSRLQHLRGMFRLAAEKVNEVTEKTLAFWLRSSAWWFLRGRTILENSVRSTSRRDTADRPSSGSGEIDLPQNKQCYVDLAKSWWIMEEVIPELLELERAKPSRFPDKIDGLNHDQLFETYQDSRREMQLFALSLDKRGLFPPPALMIQGADPLIWIPYPRLPPGLFATTASVDPRSLAKYIPPGESGFFPMPMSDTQRHFCYGRVFGEVEIMGDNEADEEAHFPSMISILRERELSHVEFMISSQDGQINVHVQSDRRVGPTWDDVEWKVKTHTLRIRLARDFGIVVRLWETDFKTLWGIHDYNKRVEQDRQPRADEEVLYKEYVGAFHYFPAKGTQPSFPATLVKNCQVRIFQTNTRINDGSGERNIFTGYRIVAVTPPYVKTVSSISRTLGDGTPIFMNKVTGEAGAPALGVTVYDANKRENVFLTFDSITSRSIFQGVLSGSDPSSDEVISDDIPFEKFSVSKLANAPADSGPCSFPPNIQWQNLKIINQGVDLSSSPILFSNRLRICVTSNHGTVTDRVNLGTGDVRIGLDAKDLTLIKLYRPPQRNLTVMFSEVEVKRDSAGPQAVHHAVSTAATIPTSRIYQFKSLPSLHEFQTLVTGFTIVYDGKATAFSISKRKPLVPGYKKLEASLVRIQVIKDENLIQLLAFFEDFVHGKCMSWVLRGTDRCESYSRSGTYFIRFVDCKFAMPKPEKDEGSDMVCVDQVEYPSEHDDIVIGFGSEDERDLFTKALPTTVTKGSKMSAFMK